MTSVTFPVAIGGDGSTVSDDDNATTGLRNGGWRTRFIPCFTNLVNIADYMVSYTAQTSTFAKPPPMGSTTPNTGAFTRLNLTGATAPANGLFLPAANSLGFATNSTERLRLDSSGNLGLGVTPGTKLDIGSGTLRIKNAGTDAQGLLIYQAASDISTIFNYYGGPLVFGTNNTERARIDSSGNLLVGTTSNNGTVTSFNSSASGRAGFFMINAASSLSADALGISKYDNNTTTSQVFVKFFINQNATASGFITANGANAATFTSSSDARLKENITALSNQLANILALKPSEFDYKDGSGHQIGFIAQEMQEVYPDCVDEDGEGMLMISGWSKTEARLVKAIQELSQELEILKSKVNA